VVIFNIPSKTITSDFQDFACSGSYLLAESSGLVFSPDGKKLAAARTNGTVCIIELATTNIVASLPIGAEWYPALAFSPDGRLLAASPARSGSAEVWDIARQQRLACFRGHGQTIIGIALFPDGDTVATASWEGTMRIWSLAQQKLIITLGGQLGSFDSITLSPDGQRLVGGSTSFVKIWDVHTWQEVASFRDHTGVIDHLAFFRDGTALVSATKDKIRLWRAPPFADTDTPPTHSAVPSAAPK
jgi:WD40 repeat protein